MINPFNKKKGLGRGLSSLIGDNDIKIKNTQISISSITPNKYQPRKNFDKESLEDLTNSIKERGVIQPLIVRKSERDNNNCLLYTSPSPRDTSSSRMPSSA